MTSITNPNQAILVTSRHNKKESIITICWHMRTSFRPELFAISVGKKRFSFELIKNSKCFAVNFMPFNLEKETIYCGTHSGKNVDKFKETGLTKEECSKINCPKIKEALGYFECKVVKEITTGDHVIFVGEVLTSKLNKKGKRLFQVEDLKFTTTLD